MWEKRGGRGTETRERSLKRWEGSERKKEKRRERERARKDEGECLGGRKRKGGETEGEKNESVIGEAMEDGEKKRPSQNWEGRDTEGGRER